MILVTLTIRSIRFIVKYGMIVTDVFLQITDELPLPHPYM